MELKILLGFSVLLLFEYLSDFIFQTREMGKEKSQDLNVLIQHCNRVLIGTYFGFLFFYYLTNPNSHYFKLAYTAALINAIFHGLIDWNIWKIYKALTYNKIKKENPSSVVCALRDFKEKRDYAEDPVFYNIIGLDRLLHVLTLLVIITILK